MARAWGFWTRAKLGILSAYLDAFTTASKSRPERLYLDLFAGEPENQERVTLDEIRGSARVALDTANPEFTRLRFFERPAQAGKLEAALRADYPGRDIQVIPGDCNRELAEVLADLRPWSAEPTFAFIDPTGPDCEWSTLETLASFKTISSYKTELWLLFPAGMFIRMLRVDGGTVRQEDAARITAMFGTEQWQEIYNARLRNQLDGGQARDEYVNLMRWRLERVLGYRFSHAFDVHEERGHSIYHMIFVTDNDAGNRIMTHLYQCCPRVSENEN
ncbi:MAG TPA: three-Cys-motif partner protein TcmP [Acidimicrobiia bacterium]|nr:three-Cys-motif partner protein TcmP [Acidimicrobiia bacterium]